MITERINSFGDIDYICECGVPITREELVCPVCNRVLNWEEFDAQNPDHKIHA